MKRFFLYPAVILASFFAQSCGSDTNMGTVEKKKKDQDVFMLSETQSVKEGVIGVFNVPEMLSLSKMDSASIEDMPDRLSKDYSLLEEELHAIGAEMEGSPGVINYNNDPKNFKFECVLLIKRIPEKTPKRCKIVALESAKMLIYNYYGPYDQLINGYNTIRDYCESKHLTQSGPMREFYITDPTVEKDPAKWMTRILVPVD